MKLSGTICRVAVALAVACSASAYAACDSPVGRDFLTVPIQSTKLSPSALLKINQAIDSAGYDVRGLLILQGCKLVFERYKKGVERDDTHALYGATTVITGALIGRLLQEGKIPSIDAPLSSLITRPILVADSDWRKLESIRLVDAMKMRSGFEWKSGVGNAVHSTRADMVRDGIKLPLVEKPGTKPNYSDFDAALVGIAVSDVTGKDLVDSAQSLLFDAMKIPRVDWDFKDRMGRYSGGFGARLRPMDMLKIGQLYLQVGAWNGVQLLQPDFAMLALPKKVLQEGGYGIMWVNGKHPDFGDIQYSFVGGRKTQRLYVFPEWDMVVALVASLPPEDDQKVSQPLFLALKASVSDGTSDPEAAKALEQLASAGFNGSRTAAEPIDTPVRAIWK